MAGPFSYIVNKFLNTRNQTQNGAGQWQPMRMAGQEIKVIGETGKEVGAEHVAIDERGKDIIIDAMEWSTNDKNTYAKLVVNTSPTSNDYLNQVFHTINSNQTRWKCTPLRVANDGHSHFEIVEYNSADDRYKLNLKAPIILPNGGYLSFNHDNPASQTVTYKIVYRVL